MTDEIRPDLTVKEGYKDCQRCGALLQPVSTDAYECQVCGMVHGPGPNLYYGSADDISFA